MVIENRGTNDLEECLSERIGRFDIGLKEWVYGSLVQRYTSSRQNLSSRYSMGKDGLKEKISIHE